jgi:hypothetical protein
MEVVFDLNAFLAKLLPFDMALSCVSHDSERIDGFSSNLPDWEHGTRPETVWCSLSRKRSKSGQETTG